MKTNQDSDVNVRSKKKMKIIGIILMLIGISLVITGIFFFIASLNSMGTKNFMLFGGATTGCWFVGAVCILSALMILIRAYQREIIRYGYEETGMALGTTSETAVDGYGRIIGKGSEALTNGIKHAGGIKLEFDTNKE
jgi:hypothetical protein